MVPCCFVFKIFRLDDFLVVKLDGEAESDGTRFVMEFIMEHMVPFLPRNM
jgi:hypothetical protein